MHYRHRHLLAIEGLHPHEIASLLDLAESYVLLNRSGKTQRDLLRGRTLINLFYEDSTRTRTSFELAGKRLGADVVLEVTRFTDPCSRMEALAPGLFDALWIDWRGGVCSRVVQGGSVTVGDLIRVEGLA